jgi:putative ABC transport system permease protein
VRNPFVTLLTLGSMALVGFALSSVTAVGLGLRAVFSASGRANRVLVMSRDATIQEESRIPKDETGRIAVTSGIVRSSLETLFNAETRLPDRSQEFLLGRGLDATGFEMYAPHLVTGRLPESGAREVIVGATVVERHPELALGGKVPVGAHNFAVVGTFSTGTSFDSEIWTTRDALIPEIRKNDPTLMVVEAANDEEARTVAERIERLPGLNLHPIIETAYYTNLINQFRPLYLGLLLVLLLIVAGAGMAATGTITVIFNRRVGDMTVLRTIGFHSSAVAELLFAETEFLALGGGAVGAAGAFFALRNYVAFTRGQVSITFRTPVTPSVLGVTLTILALIGATGVILPIVRMLRIEIRDGLRDE